MTVFFFLALVLFVQVRPMLYKMHYNFYLFYAFFSVSTGLVIYCSCLLTVAAVANTAIDFVVVFVAMSCIIPFLKLFITFSVSASFFRLSAFFLLASILLIPILCVLKFVFLAARLTVFLLSLQSSSCLIFHL